MNSSTNIPLKCVYKTNANLASVSCFLELPYPQYHYEIGIRSSLLTRISSYVVALTFWHWTLKHMLVYLLVWVVPVFNELILLYDTDDESATAANQPVRGSFLNLLPPQMEVPEKSESQWFTPIFCRISIWPWSQPNVDDYWLLYIFSHSFVRWELMDLEARSLKFLVFGWLIFLADWDIFRVEKSFKVYILQFTFYQTAMC